MRNQKNDCAIKRNKNLETSFYHKLMYPHLIAQSQNSPMPKRTKTSTKSTKKSRVTPKAKKLEVGKVKVPRVVSFGKQVLPNLLKNTLKYHEAIAVTLTSGFGQHLYSCNGLYDPNTSGVGHQPRGFDQLIALYNHYTVTASRIKVTPGTLSATAVQQLCVYLDDDTTTSVTTMSQAMERKTATSSPLFTSNELSRGIVRNSWSLSEVFGPNGMNNTLYRGTAAANPTEQTFFVITYEDWQLGTGSYPITVEIEYDVVWEELTSFASS